MRKYIVLLILLHYSLFGKIINANPYIYNSVSGSIFVIKIPENFTFQILKSKLTKSQNTLEILSKKDDTIVSLGETYFHKDKSNLTNDDLSNILEKTKIKSLHDFVEKDYIFKYFKNVKSSYLELTDKKLVGKEIKSNDFKYFTIGMISIKNYSFTFFILTNNRNSKEYKSIINMFNESFFTKKNDSKN